MGQVYKSATFEAARAGSWEIGMEAAAERVKIIVKSVAATHSKSGHFLASIGVTESVSRRGVRDFIVSSDDPQAGDIEFGHFLTYQDPATGETVHTERWVPGLFLFRTAFNIAKSTG